MLNFMKINFSVNVTKFAVFCEFGHIYLKKCLMENFIFFVQWKDSDALGCAIICAKFTSHHSCLILPLYLKKDLDQKRKGCL